MKPYIILTLLIILAYANSLQNLFLHPDDYLLIVENPKINLPLSELPSVFTTPLLEMAGHTEIKQVYYRPMASFFLVLNYKIWGLNPVGFHLTGIILHLISAMVLYRIGLIFFNDKLISLIGASIFAVHPVNNESVGKAVPSDVIFGFFLILSLYFFLKEKRYISWFTYFLALLSKETAVMLPFALVILAIHKKGLKDGIIQITPYVMLVGIYLILRAMIVDTVFGEKSQQPIFTQTITMAVAAFDYIRLLIIPYPLSPFYPARWYTSINEPKVIFAIITLILVSMLVFKIRKDGAMLFCLTSPFIMLLPVILNVNTILGDSFIAERFLYVPAMLFSLFISAYVVRLFKNIAMVYLAAGWVLVVIIFTYITVSANRIWESDLPHMKAFKATLEIQEKYLRYLEKDSFYSNTHYALGNNHYKFGQSDEAMQEWQRAVELNPKNSLAHNSIGNVYLSRGDYLMAITAYKDAINADPNNAEAHYNLSLALEKVGKKDEAVYEYMTALKLNPELNLSLQVLSRDKSIKIQEGKPR